MPERPCRERHPDPASTAGECVACERFVNDPRFRALWGGEGGPEARPRRRVSACRHRGAAAGEEACGTCPGATRVKLFGCARHNVCSLAKELPGKACCASCPDREEYPVVEHAGAVRHLLYYVYPLPGTLWIRHVERLRARLPLFNGRRVIAVAIDGASRPFDEVRGLFRADDVEFLPLTNDPGLREVAAFEALWSKVETADPTHATLFAHAKGVTKPTHGAVLRWADALYATMFDHWPAVQAVLQTHPLAGAFKKLGRGWPAHESLSEWHYSGSWVWFRNADVFAKDWRRIDHFHAGVEPWASLHFPAEAAGCVFHEAPVPAMNLYRDDTWSRVGPALAKWLAANAHRRTDGPAAIKVEVGGGESPRGGGFVNVDVCEGADVRCDVGRERWPFADDSVSEVYSSHCLEHVPDLRHALRELVRVCRAGAAVELRVPHWLSQMANCHGHVQTVGEEQVRHWTESAVPYWFGGSPKRLKLLRTELVPGPAFGKWRGAVPPSWSDEDVMRLCPDACHESRFSLEVVPND